MSEMILITGAAGFIGHALAARLLQDGARVVGVDNLNDYYPPALKHARLALLEAHPNFAFQPLELTDAAAVEALFAQHKPSVAVHLAAQAGVRYSLEAPRRYIESNISGFLNVLEACRTHPVKHLLYASSSSVYGANTAMPFCAAQPADHPISLYGATKKAGEAMAHSYSHLFGIPMTGLRFFTVYGPWGRPDMAYFSFACKMLRGETIEVFNEGKMRRDFTYIDDIVEGMARLMPLAPKPAVEASLDHSAAAPYRIYNIGHHSPVELGRFIDILEEKLGVKAKCKMLPMQPGDVPATFADVAPLMRDTGFAPRISLEEGLGTFATWLKHHPEFQQIA